MIELEAGDYRLGILPDRGGSLAYFAWRGEPLMRPVCGTGIFDVACFPLVPFSNRIAHGRFRSGESLVELSPNFPGSDHPHPLHGFGWLASWTVIANGPQHCVLEHRYQAAQWPWSYVARQVVRLSPEGLSLDLTLTNLGNSAMPAGLGFHPYFPRTKTTRYHGLHLGEWHNTVDGLPDWLEEKEIPVDWWAGKPVESRDVDTVYTGRSGDLAVIWPDRNLTLRCRPSANMPLTVVFSPKGAEFLCVEPVTHMTDAVNRQGVQAMPFLAPACSLTASARFAAHLHSQ